MSFGTGPEVILSSGREMGPEEGMAEISENFVVVSRIAVLLLTGERADTGDCRTGAGSLSGAGFEELSSTGEGVESGDCETKAGSSLVEILTRSSSFGRLLTRETSLERAGS